MAEIAIEGKSRGSRILWLVAALLIVALIWWLATRDREAVNTTGTTMTPAGQTAGSITGLNQLYAVNDAAAFANREVAITEPVRVLSVTGDRTFWVGQGVGQQVLVRLEEVATPGQPAIEGRYDVTAGQTIRIWGDVRRFPGFTEAQRTWNLNPNVEKELDNQSIYIHANRLEIVTRP